MNPDCLPNRVNKDDKGNQPVVAVVIPCYRVANTIASVVRQVLQEDVVSMVICIDDACPENSSRQSLGEFQNDLRVKVISLPTNRGVGGATKVGYVAAIRAGADIIVKVDGDGQMIPNHITNLISPIERGEADYVKGNRFFSLTSLARMPLIRKIGNAGLSFFNKLSSGYWNLFDPTNGYTAIESRVAAHIPFDKVHNRFFFEQDLLFRLSIIRACVTELPMAAVYGEEESNLSIFRAFFRFPFCHAINLGKRIFYNYFLRNFSLASINLILGLLFLVAGVVFGGIQWWISIASEEAATAGTVMLAALPIILGIQFLLNFLGYDMIMVPREAVHPKLPSLDLKKKCKLSESYVELNISDLDSYK